jgi:hypothetical protein
MQPGDVDVAGRPRHDGGTPAGGTSMWFAAHVIMYFKFKDGQQDSYPVWENVFLVEAPNAEEGHQKAERLGQADEGDSGGSLTCGGRPCTLTYAGIRKLVTVQGGVDNPGDLPADGAEVTYSQLVLKDAKALAWLVGGKPVTVRYEE